ncbi:MAG: hypothetical protein L3J49_02415 [Desulfobulbaceae bacterium]|nr:hypothetical protein [Desulfobulbaceae bacterium]
MTTQKTSCCDLCGQEKKIQTVGDRKLCSICKAIAGHVKNHPEEVRKIWVELYDESITPNPQRPPIKNEKEMPDVLDGKRYRAVDRENNKWYLSVSEVDGHPVEVFASTAFDRDNELQSRISNLTTITRLIALILRHLFLGERLTLAKCLKQIQRSSRQRDDLPDMLYRVLSRYTDEPDQLNHEQQSEEKKE